MEGVGPIALPLLPHQAAALAAAAERAPFGRKEATVYDDAVRKTWQFSSSKFTIQNPAWTTECLERILAVAKAGLGCANTDDVNAELYKLLLYEPGSHFKPHRDTEKAPGMFATLVVVLPSLWTGGDLVVRHASATRRFGPELDSAFSTRYIAFFADCEHEVTPVTSGYSLALVYNLTVKGARLPVTPSLAGSAVDAICAGLTAWAAHIRAATENPDGDGIGPPPKHLVFLLDHRYTQADLAPSRLKGKDRTRAEVLARAAAATTGKSYLSMCGRRCCDAMSA